MKYSRKMKLVDVDNILSEQRENQITETSLSKLDKNMKRILDLENISDDQKLKLYNSELQKYIFFYKQQKKPKEFKIEYDDDNEKIFEKNLNNIKKEIENSQPSSDYEFDHSLLTDDDEDNEPKPPKTSTPFKDHTKDSKSLFFSPLQTTLTKVPSLSPSSAKIFKVQKESDGRVKRVLNRSQHLTRNLVASSSKAATSFKNWISLSKRNK